MKAAISINSLNFSSNRKRRR